MCPTLALFLRFLQGWLAHAHCDNLFGCNIVSCAVISFTFFLMSFVQGKMPIHRHDKRNAFTAENRTWLIHMHQDGA